MEFLFCSLSRAPLALELPCERMVGEREREELYSKSNTHKEFPQFFNMMLFVIDDLIKEIEREREGTEHYTHKEQIHVDLKRNAFLFIEG